MSVRNSVWITPRRGVFMLVGREMPANGRVLSK